MNQRHKHADVIIAWAEGKDVQVWDKNNERWCDMVLADPNFRADKYRIKPPAKKYRVALFKDCTNGSIYTRTANTQEDADFLEAAPSFVRWLTDWVEYEEG